MDDVTVAEASHPDVQDARPGRIVAGRYELVSVLGRGGTSTVYRAIHTFTHRPVALKLLSPRHARDGDLVERFLREARAATALVHHNTVEVLDMGVDDDGEVYLAMELLDGETLFEVIERERPVGPTRLAEMILPIIDVLASAHRMGIVHRDIKPENVMIARGPGDAERPVLLDFGIAKVREATRRTENGVILGTPFYMSPEQIGGEQSVGPPSDVWSMGVLIYEALAGELPFASSSLPSLFVSIAGNHRALLRERMPAISEGWSCIVERALSTAPSDRFADASELAAAIRAELAGAAPLVTRQFVSDTIGPPPLSSSPPPAAPRRTWTWAVAAGVVVLTGVVLWSVTTLGVEVDSAATSPGASIEGSPSSEVVELSGPATLIDTDSSGDTPEAAAIVSTPPVSDEPSTDRAARRPRSAAPVAAESPAAVAVEEHPPARGLPEMATEW